MEICIHTEIIDLNTLREREDLHTERKGRNFSCDLERKFVGGSEKTIEDSSFEVIGSRNEFY